MFTLPYGTLSHKFHTVLSSYFTTATHSWILYLHFFFFFAPSRMCEIRCHLISVIQFQEAAEEITERSVECKRMRCTETLGF